MFPFIGDLGIVLPDQECPRKILTSTLKDSLQEWNPILYGLPFIPHELVQLIDSYTQDLQKPKKQYTGLMVETSRQYSRHDQQTQFLPNSTIIRQQLLKRSCDQFLECSGNIVVPRLSHKDETEIDATFILQSQLSRGEWTKERHRAIFLLRHRQHYPHIPLTTIPSPDHFYQWSIQELSDMCDGLTLCRYAPLPEAAFGWFICDRIYKTGLWNDEGDTIHQLLLTEYISKTNEIHQYRDGELLNPNDRTAVYHRKCGRPGFEPLPPLEQEKLNRLKLITSELDPFAPKASVEEDDQKWTELEKRINQMKFAQQETNTSTSSTSSTSSTNSKYINPLTNVSSTSTNLLN